jgi:hypothetical protein
MARLILMMVCVYVCQAQAYVSTEDFVPYESKGSVLGTQVVDKSALGGASQYGALTALSVTESQDEMDLTITGEPLNYPNPFKIRSGTTIGYTLTQDSNVQIDIYNAFGYKILTKHIESGANGASATQYNRVPITYQDFNYDLPAGPYFYTILANNTLLAKGRMAIIP